MYVEVMEDNDQLLRELAKVSDEPTEEQYITKENVDAKIRDTN